MGDRHGPRRIEIWLPLVIVILDQVTKALVREHLAVHESIPIIPSLLDFTHVRNTGAAFGFLNAAEFPFKSVVLSLVATGALVAMALYSAALASHQFLARIGLALVIGGAVGNLIDRMLHGAVIDFVDVYWRTHHFWTFNVADSAITIGVIVLILDMLGVGNRPHPASR